MCEVGRRPVLGVSGLAAVGKRRALGRLSVGLPGRAFRGRWILIVSLVVLSSEHPWRLFLSSETSRILQRSLLPRLPLGTRLSWVRCRCHSQIPPHWLHCPRPRLHRLLLSSGLSTFAQDHQRALITPPECLFLVPASLGQHLKKGVRLDIWSRMQICSGWIWPNVLQRNSSTWVVSLPYMQAHWNT